MEADWIRRDEGRFVLNISSIRSGITLTFPIISTSYLYDVREHFRVDWACPAIRSDICYLDPLKYDVNVTRNQSFRRKETDVYEQNRLL